MNLENSKILVAPSSTHGHFVNGAIKVVNLDEINETFLVKVGKSKVTLDTSNHTSLNIEEDSLITCQNVFNPFSLMYEKSKD